MGKYQAYPEYKDSGVEWLGKIPVQWQCIKLKYVASLEGRKTQDDLTAYKYVGLENIESWSGTYIQGEVIQPEGVSTTFNQEDVLFGKLRPYLAKSWLAAFSGICSSEFLVLRSKKVSPRFLNYYFLTEEVIKQVDSSTYGSKMPRASWDFIGLMDVSVPVYADSEKIASFLDHETAKIDTLIDKQQQLIQLLKEKRQAVISHAVTKGLNPNAPMRDSGVEWLGEVPEHWEILQLRRLTKLQQGLQIPQEDRFAEKGSDRVEYITIKSINAGLEAEHKEYIQSPSKRVVCLEDDVLLARTGATGQVITGVVGAFHNNFFKINYDQNKILKEYLVYFLRVTEVKDHLLMLAGTTTIPDLNHGAFLGTLICLPSIEEQRDICRYLDKAIEDYDYNIELAQRLIGLLHERRTALISAAVTGKIDVRHHVSRPTGNDTSEVSA